MHNALRSLRCGAVSLFTTVAVLNFANSTRATDYYLDSVSGNDSNAGTSAAAPWRTATHLFDVTFHPGDNVYFKRGGSYDLRNNSDGSSSWDPGLWPQSSSSGTAGSPVTFTNYGEGALPAVFNGRNTDNSTVFSLRSAYTVLDGLAIGPSKDSGIIVESMSNHVTIRNCEIHHVGAGVITYGPYVTITRNYFHDGTMIRNTPGGDDDYGANGIIISGPNVEISYNFAERLAADSYDYTYDGGFVELYGGFSEIAVHHNVVRDTIGFFEGGSGGDETISNVTVAYNLGINNGGICALHNGGDGFAANFVNLVVANNTFIETGDASMVWLSGNPGAGSMTFRNNIFSMGGGRVFNRVGSLVHDHNIYPTSGTLGVTLGTGETAADPHFVNAGAEDFHLAASSAAIDNGASPTYSNDLDGVSVPIGSAADIGCYEYVPPGVDAGVTDGGAVPIDAGAFPDMGHASDMGASSDMGSSSSDMGSSSSDMGASSDMGGSSSDMGGSSVDMGGSVVDGGVSSDMGGSLVDAGHPSDGSVPSGDAGNVPGTGVAPLAPGCNASQTQSGGSAAAFGALAALGALGLLMRSRRRRNG